MSTILSPDERGIEQPREEPLPDLYAYSKIITEGADGFAHIDSEDMEFFREHGYLVVHNAFSAEEVKTAKQSLTNLISGSNIDFKGFMFEAKASDILESLSPEQKLDYVRKFMWFVNYDDHLKSMSEKPELTDLLAKLIGEKPYMFQDMALVKPPKIGREKPWHQDFAYFNLPLGTQVVGAWIALDEAMVENGCMHVIPGSHREGPVVHFQRRDWQICDTDVRVQQSVAIPLKPGGCLLFDGMLHHGTPSSHSEKRRRALQFHYRPTSVEPYVDSTQRLSIFGEEGKDVYC